MCTDLWPPLFEGKWPKGGETFQQVLGETLTLPSPSPPPTCQGEGKRSGTGNWSISLLPPLPGREGGGAGEEGRGGEGPGGGQARRQCVRACSSIFWAWKWLTRGSIRGSRWPSRIVGSWWIDRPIRWSVTRLWGKLY